ncbi:acyltransferase [uncultured Sneathiella sp.]|uniref:acyltransferase family protein n=1 Tax=uncultured Sneathiella sp. TaxID=879315 RepID=UPI0030DB1B0C
MKYRPEIDGLRAIAVTLVLLQHAAFTIAGSADWSSRTYIGVDIFFVISGYLITTLLLNELRETGTINFWHFYERRARRILPALFFVLLAFLPVAFILLSGGELKTFLLSVLSAVFFGSNIFFYFESHFFVSDHFGVDRAFVEGFLHTWSLAIEEQFYLLFPVLLILVNRFFSRYFLLIFIVLFCLSLQFSELMGARHIDFNYLLLPSRFWELLAGAILAYVELKYGKIRRPFLNTVMPLVGLCLIGGYLLQYRADLLHPGFATFIPVLGTVLIIAFSSKEDMVGRILGSKPFVAIGLISYSLYLWHLPVFTSLHLINPVAGNFDKLGWVVLSLALSAISYYLIEKPFRNREIIRARPFFLSIGTSAIVIVLLSLPVDLFSITGPSLAGH